MSEMNEEGIRMLVQQILRYGYNRRPELSDNAINQDANTFAYGVRMPLNLDLTESDDGKVISFVLSLPNDPGRLTVSYSPQHFLEDYVKTRQIHKSSDVLSDEEFRELIIPEIYQLVDMFLHIFPTEMAETANLQMLLSQKIIRFLTEKDFLQNKVSDGWAKINEIIEFANRERRSKILLLKDSHSTSLTAPTYLFSVVYADRHKVWQDIKKFYTAHKTSPKLEKLIKDEFEDEFAGFGFPDDLIKKLWLKGEVAKAPRDLALKETSRILEIPTKKVETESLGDFLTQSQDEAKLVSSVKAAADLKEFFDYKKTRDAHRERRQNLIKKAK